MSDPLRIGLVAEGITDKLVIQAAIESLLGERRFILRLLQPEESLPFGLSIPSLSQGKGWGGVYLWSQGVRQRNGGRLDGDILFSDSGYDILIVHLDADVAGKNYSDCEINDPTGDLPCEEQCPPPSATTDRLRAVLLRWLGETTIPAKTVLCTPSKSCETWVIAALFPDDSVMIQKGWECHPKPESRLGTKPKAQRVTKSKAGYEAVQDGISAAWPRLRAELSEAERFSNDFVSAVGTP
jgi:hypothetical protein